MTYKELYDKALWELEHNNITLGEFDDMIEPLNKEIPAESEKETIKKSPCYTCTLNCNTTCELHKRWLQKTEESEEEE